MRVCRRSSGDDSVGASSAGALMTAPARRARLDDGDARGLWGGGRASPSRGFVRSGCCGAQADPVQGPPAGGARLLVVVV